MARPRKITLTIRYRHRHSYRYQTQRYTCTRYDLTHGWVTLHNAQPINWEGRPTTRHPHPRLAIPTRQIDQLAEH